MPKSVKKVLPSKATPATLLANLSLFSDSKNTLAVAQIFLLEAIAETGSISAAAKKVGISYKTAWERVEAINNIAEKPLVVRSAGGSQGGGTQVTDFGMQIIHGFRAMEEEHEAFLQRLGNKVASIDDIAHFMKVGTMKTSARNQFRGVVSAITPGAVNTEIHIRISDSIGLDVIITEESCKVLGLKPGSVVVALVKSSSVILSKDVNIAVSARNKLTGKVLRITPGAVNSDVVVDLGDSKSISAIITNGSVNELGIAEGDEVCAFFKASSVILLVE